MRLERPVRNSHRAGPVACAILALAALLAAPAVSAQAFRSISDPAAILYDGPSAKAKRLWVLGRGSPVQVVVVTEGWTKVRDATGALAWVEIRALSSARWVLVRAATGTMRDSPAEAGAVVLRVGRDVVLDMVEPPAGEWVRVRHRDGAIGFIHVNQVFGS